METIKKSILVHAPVQKVFDFLNDPHKLLDYWPGFVEVKDVKPLANGGTRFDYVYKVAGIRLQGSSEDTEVVPLKRMVSVSSGGIDSKVIWELEETGDGTLVNLWNQYAIPVPVIGRLAEGMVRKINDQEADVIMTTLKALLEA